MYMYVTFVDREGQQQPSATVIMKHSDDCAMVAAGTGLHPPTTSVVALILIGACHCFMYSQPKCSPQFLVSPLMARKSRCCYSSNVRYIDNALFGTAYLYVFLAFRRYWLATVASGKLRFLFSSIWENSRLALLLRRLASVLRYVRLFGLHQKFSRA